MGGRWDKGVQLNKGYVSVLQVIKLRGNRCRERKITETSRSRPCLRPGGEGEEGGSGKEKPVPGEDRD